MAFTKTLLHFILIAASLLLFNFSICSASSRLMMDKPEKPVTQQVRTYEDTSSLVQADPALPLTPVLTSPTSPSTTVTNPTLPFFEEPVPPVTPVNYPFPLPGFPSLPKFPPFPFIPTMPSIPSVPLPPTFTGSDIASNSVPNQEAITP